MQRTEIAPGAFVTAIPGGKFKRGIVSAALVEESARETASALAVLPHVLERRSAAVPDATLLSRRLFDLYGADLSADSYTAGANRVVSLGVSGIKSAFAMDGEDLAGEYLDLLFGLLFAPVLERGAFAAEDVDIERGKQTDYLKSEMNDKRTYCLRQGRRKLFGAGTLGIESAGYLEDMPGVTPQVLHGAWQATLRRARLELFVCGVDVDEAAGKLAAQLKKVERAPLAPPPRELPAQRPSFEQFSEPMDTVQGKLCILATSQRLLDARFDAVMRVANAVLGGLPTSRLFTNVREKQSLCYYCASGFTALSGVLTLDSGVEHKNAARAAKAMLHELETLQSSPATDAELDDAKRAITTAYTAAKDAPDALVGFSFNELLKGTGATLDEAAEAVQSVTKDEVREALASFAPAVQYTITQKEGR